MSRKTVVYVIESPSPTNLIDDVHEGRTLCAALTHAGMRANLFTVVNLDMIYEAFARICLSIQKDLNDIVPFIHFSMHGNDDGVALTDDHRISWESLGNMCGFANSRADGRLFLAMSTCHGFSGVKMAHRSGPHPFFALVGPKRDVKWRDTIAAFVAMYHHAEATAGALMDAVGIMNQVIAASDPLFDVALAENEQARHLDSQTKGLASFAGKVASDMGNAQGSGARHFRGLMGSLASIPSGLSYGPAEKPK